MSLKKIAVWKKYELENGPLTEDQVLTQVGMMLFLLHQFEQTMRLCTALLQTAAMSKIDDTIERLWRMKKATCGQLAVELRKFVQIEKGFDQLMSRLIKRRNIFVHKLSVHSPFKLTAGKAWVQNVPRFVWALHADLIKVEDVFLAYLQACDARFEGKPVSNLPGEDPYPLHGFKLPRVDVRPKESQPK